MLAVRLMVRLRAHHLLCVLTYVGKGYGATFVENYNAIATRLSAGEAALIVAGPDDICSPLLGAGYPHCRRQSVIERDRLAARDIGRSTGISIDVGTTLILDTHRLTRMRAAFTAGTTRAACKGCEWVGLCSDVADRGYAATRI